MFAVKHMNGFISKQQSVLFHFSENFPIHFSFPFPTLNADKIYFISKRLCPNISKTVQAQCYVTADAQP